MKQMAVSSHSGVIRWRAAAATAFRANSFSFLLLLAVSACSATGVVATNDPYEKLAQAEQLSDAGRVSAARGLIVEAIETFESRGEDLGLAEAYRGYGFFVREHGDGTVLQSAQSDSSPANENSRFDTSIEYFERSLTLAEAGNELGLATNLHLDIGVSHYFAGRLGEACRSFDIGLATYRRWVEIRPNLSVELPAGVMDYPDLIERTKQQTGCG